MDITRIARELKKALEEQKKRPAPLDTEATVKRIEKTSKGSIAWVHIPGGVEETPVQMTVNAEAGDKVQVRVSSGRAWITGNTSAPPTDDRAAENAGKAARAAAMVARAATEAVDKLREYTERACRIADDALTSANGKNTNYYSETQPEGDTFAEGDLWFRIELLDGNPVCTGLYKWDGTEWVLQPLADGAFASLDVGKLVGGYIDAIHINAAELTIGGSHLATEEYVSESTSTIWTSNVAPIAPDYTFPIAGISGSDNSPNVGDMIIWSYYRYAIESVEETTVRAGGRVSIRGEQGEQGIQGDPGDQGEQGVSVSTVRTQYYLSTSSASTAGGGWSYEPQAFISGRFYWTRDHVTFSDGSAGDTTPVYNRALTQANEQAIASGKTATNFITHADSSGTWVTAQGHGPTNGAATSGTRGVRITDQIDIFRGMDSVAAFGEKARVGKTSGMHTETEENKVGFYSGNTLIGAITAEGDVETGEGEGLTMRGHAGEGVKMIYGDPGDAKCGYVSVENDYGVRISSTAPDAMGAYVALTAETVDDSEEDEEDWAYYENGFYITDEGFEFQANTPSAGVWKTVGSLSRAGVIDCTGGYQRNGNALLVQEERSADNITIKSESGSAEADKNPRQYTFSVAKAKYTPIGIVGFDIDNASSNGTNVSHCVVMAARLSGTSALFQIKNNASSNAKIKLICKVLYIAT